MVNAKDYVQHMELDLQAALDKTFVHVFVMGPAPEPESTASLLRRELVEKCKAFGYSAFMEHGEIIASVRGRAGARADLAYIEEVHAEGVHVLVFLPWSPGSFAELGFFAGLARGLAKGGHQTAAAELIGKSLILLDADLVEPPPDSGELTRGFVADGPAMMLEDLGAKVIYVPYGDIAKAWSHVQRRVEAAKRFESRRAK